MKSHLYWHRYGNSWTPLDLDGGLKIALYHLGALNPKIRIFLHKTLKKVKSQDYQSHYIAIWPLLTLMLKFDVICVLENEVKL